MTKIKSILFIAFFLLSIFSIAENIERRLDYAESLNGTNDSEMLRISDSVIWLSQSDNSNITIQNINKAAYLKARILNRRGNLKSSLKIIDSILSINQTNSSDVYF